VREGKGVRLEVLVGTRSQESRSRPSINARIPKSVALSAIGGVEPYPSLANRDDIMFDASGVENTIVGLAWRSGKCEY
jgi:hypothetical protein